MSKLVHPIFQAMFADMGRVGLLPKSDAELDRELELEGVCVFPQMDETEHDFNNAGESRQGAK